MRPLILEYAEIPKSVDVNIDSIEYCEDKNLSVLKGTSEIAVSYANLETETFTKVQGEVSDSDKDLRSNLKDFMGTETLTLTDIEASDSDKDRVRIEQLLDTQTVNESEGDTDRD